MRVLLVEDDQHLGEMIHGELQRKKFMVTWVKTLAQAQGAHSKTHYDLAIIDLNLPDGIGFDLIPPLTCPVIIMSALNDPENRLKGAELGAVDFIPKPFLLQELFLKIEQSLGESALKPMVFTDGAVTLDLKHRQIQNGKDTHLLNKRDFRLINILVEKAPDVVSRNSIIDHVYGEDQNPSQRTVDNAVVGIRQMLSDDGSRWIRSVRGEGYQWIAKEQKNG